MFYTGSKALEIIHLLSAIQSLILALRACSGFLPLTVRFHGDVYFALLCTGTSLLARRRIKDVAFGFISV